jgi:hypothetical protein
MGLKETLSIIIAIANKSLYETDRAQLKIPCSLLQGIFPVRNFNRSIIRSLLRFRILMDKLGVHSGIFTKIKSYSLCHEVVIKGKRP